MKRIPESAIAEASRWFALLHGSERSADAELLFRKWSQASACNEAAYDWVTSTWERSQHLPKPPLPLPKKWQRAGFRSGFRRAITAVAATTVMAIIAGLLYVRSGGIQTNIGEQRTVTLLDGTRVSLNTDTRLIVQYDKHRRAVALKKGEALFEVARDAQRPFIVVAGGREVTALGTVFVVRNVADILAVTLVEGKISVSKGEGGQAAQTLEPGQRLVFEKAVAPKIDQPEVEKVMAWRRGRIEMERTPLYSAATEMNRYSTIKLAIERPEAQVLPVTGSFRSGDVMSFADTLARACHLGMVRKKDGITLTGVPSDNCR
jgi:transmembrane sensor